MKTRFISRCALVLAGLATTVILLAPVVPAFALLGFSLGLDQRDVRVFDNFTTSTNTTPDPNWPGAVGAPLAIWKAVAEWGSQLHGNGSGDPSQPSGVGSGSANFDSTWQGLAPGPGGPNDNVVSLMSGCGGGIVGSVDIGANGWRIRLCDSWSWFDGPGTNVPASAIDLQGVVCYEYGRALGLGHSTVVGATLYPAIAGNGVTARSIEADDVAGIQAIYGAWTATKPRITSVTLSQGTVTIHGANFDISGNEAWFTRANGNATGSPVKVVGLYGGPTGTTLAMPLPVDAGPGDVLVRTTIAQNQLSNAYPFRPAGCGQMHSYCVGKTNSQGCIPEITAFGTPSASFVAPCQVMASRVINNKPGLLLYAYGSAATPFQGGTLCLAPPLKRTPAQNSGGNPGADDCSGSFSFQFNALILSGTDPGLVGGATVYAQYYYRDPADAFGVGLTNALEMTICP